MKTPAGSTLQDDTYATLRGWLTVGRFVPGERLKIRQVAEALGVGEMPVRAALQRLAAEGALVNVPNCGVTVPQLSRAQFDDVLQVRLMLEGEAAEKGAHRLDDAGRAELRALSDAMRAALDAGDAKAYLDANERFHLILYRASGSPLLLELIETVWMQVGPVSNQLFEDSAFALRLNDAHEDVVEAVERGDSAGVRRAIERDLFYAAQQLRAVCTGERQGPLRD
ncbi:GntR family transcriptional regulator [Niveibacterium umoris]|uniref:DNA-binding GntR family transcriptional regulator n=1 Tax=Niveibacterium umoris TaxID=1193620 RepID=A0A840BJ24_9RHOO|nr:GntR family transcriptional regulator [Niveibacterium umoris]MBB4012633.1 DNA-binding GntR family transcriptional regulator [Niveibacterium umoris]